MQQKCSSKQKQQQLDQEGRQALSNQMPDSSNQLPLPIAGEMQQEQQHIVPLPGNVPANQDDQGPVQEQPQQQVGGSNPGASDNFAANPMITTTTVQGTIGWHNSVSPDIRNHLVRKLVQALMPSPDPLLMFDQRMQNLVAFAKQVEEGMYGLANSRLEYYNMMGKQIYKIQKDMESKRHQRREQQVQRQAQ